MNELQRTQYLEEMGIEVFVPRFVLPAAKPSVQAVLPMAPSDSVPLGNVAPEQVALDSAVSSQEESFSPSPKSAASVTGILTNIIGDLGGTTKQLSESSVFAKNEQSSVSDAVALSSARPAATPEQVAFSLSLWRVNSNLMVIDSRHPKQALPTSVLLGNMLFAKGVSQRLPVPEVLVWPMFEHAQTLGGWQEAADMVNAFLNARLSSQPAQYLWLMGESAYKAVLGDQAQDYSSQIGHALDIADFSVLALVLPSLTDMLLQPELKRQTWNTIRPYGIE